MITKIFKVMGDLILISVVLSNIFKVKVQISYWIKCLPYLDGITDWNPIKQQFALGGNLQSVFWKSFIYMFSDTLF